MKVETCVTIIKILGYNAEIDECGFPVFLLTEAQYKKGWRKYERIIRSLGWKRTWTMKEIKK